MIRSLAVILCAGLLAGAAAAQDDEEEYGPSFDCAKASTPGEKIVCESPGLGWYDRQLAKGYALAKTAVGKAGEAELKESQQTFISIRDTCRGEDPYGCVVQAYMERLNQLAAIAGKAGFGYGDYSSNDGSVSLAIYPDKAAALTISTVGGGDHTCAFETDRAQQGKGGTITYSAAYEGMPEACKIEATPSGNAITVTATVGCSYWCGARAVLDGTYTKN